MDTNFREAGRVASNAGRMIAFSAFVLTALILTSDKGDVEVPLISLTLSYSSALSVMLMLKAIFTYQFICLKNHERILGKKLAKEIKDSQNVDESDDVNEKLRAYPSIFNAHIVLVSIAASSGAVQVASWGVITLVSLAVFILPVLAIGVVISSASVGLMEWVLVTLSFVFYVLALINVAASEFIGRLLEYFGNDGC